MKKYHRGVVTDTDPYAMFENPRIRIKHQSLLQDYEDLQNETEAMTGKLLIAKQKKLTLLAEVRFLRRRYEFLKNQSSNPQPKHGLKQPQNFEIGTTNVKKIKNCQKKKASLKPLAQANDLYQREGIYNGTQAAFRKSQPIIHVNQKPRIWSEKEVTMHNSSPIFDPKERAYREQEAAANRNTTPVFDLNQIAREEEELQASFEPLRMEEPKKSLLRSGNDAKNCDLKMSVCRNVGNGANRVAKRKISWQDQVALRA